MSLTSKRRVDWHEAASCAFKIELKDYSHVLEYISEYPLGKNSYRIDLLVIKKLTDEMDFYYKTIGYAGLLIAQMGKSDSSSHGRQYSSLDVSLTLLSCHYPRKLIKHLKQERNLPVAKIYDGVYYINKETFIIQIIVTKELSPEDNLYLHCLTDNLQDIGLINRLADDCKLHPKQDIYNKYMHQITTANSKTKGEQIMVCEGILNLYGTSSAEIIERTKKEDAEYYLPKIDDLSSQVAYLKSLLTKNNIPFDLE